MKRLMTTITALTLASVMALMNPVKILASNTTGAVYLSEIRVGMGKSSSEAANALEGYTIVTDDSGKKVDFNSNAGGGAGLAVGALVSGLLVNASEKKKRKKEETA